ncbi:MAG: DUF2520 domain-containing protein [Balneolaceae bacterium]|nr:DUF2520 domain-containing protein [Balneolaceae bacterium]
MSFPPVSLIGTGALGGAFLEAFSELELDVAGVYNRTPSRATRHADRFSGARSGAFPDTTDELGGLLLLAVPDGAVAETAARLAGLGGIWEGRCAVHCSGTLTSDALSPLSDKGARTASFHPLQSFTAEGGGGARLFDGICFSTEGDARALHLLEKLARLLNARLLKVRPQQKPHIHLAAVFASNYLVALLEAAGRAGAESEEERGELVRALGPLVRQTAENIAVKGTGEALSGPISRGDAGTVEKHLELLEDHPRLREIYRLLGAELLDLVKGRSEEDDPRTNAYLEKLLER